MTPRSDRPWSRDTARAVLEHAAESRARLDRMTGSGLCGRGHTITGARDLDPSGRCLGCVDDAERERRHLGTRWS